MIQPTAPAETGLPSPPTNYYVWSFPGSITVHLSLDVVKALETHLPGMPQGLLFGKPAGAATEISGFKLLSSSELAAMALKGELPEMTGGLRPVGFFRVQKGGDLRLTAEDLALAKAVFPDAYDVFLVIQTDGPDPANASFFFWDGDCIHADFTFLEFPFDAVLLAGRNTARQPRIPRAEEFAGAPAVPESIPSPQISTAGGETKKKLKFGAM